MPGCGRMWLKTTLTCSSERRLHLVAADGAKRDDAAVGIGAEVGRDRERVALAVDEDDHGVLEAGGESCEELG